MLLQKEAKIREMLNQAHCLENSMDTGFTPVGMDMPYRIIVVNNPIVYTDPTGRCWFLPYNGLSPQAYQATYTNPYSSFGIDTYSYFNYDSGSTLSTPPNENDVYENSYQMFENLLSDTNGLTDNSIDSGINDNNSPPDLGNINNYYRSDQNPFVTQGKYGPTHSDFMRQRDVPLADIYNVGKMVWQGLINPLLKTFQYGTPIILVPIDVISPEAEASPAPNNK